MLSGPVLNGPIGPRAEVIYSRQFKYTQQHTAGFTENSNLAQHLLRLTLLVMSSEDISDGFGVFPTIVKIRKFGEWSLN